MMQLRSHTKKKKSNKRSKLDNYLLSPFNPMVKRPRTRRKKSETPIQLGVSWQLPSESLPPKPLKRSLRESNKMHRFLSKQFRSMVVEVVEHEILKTDLYELEQRLHQLEHPSATTKPYVTIFQSSTEPTKSFRQFVEFKNKSKGIFSVVYDKIPLFWDLDLTAVLYVLRFMCSPLMRQHEFRLSRFNIHRLWLTAYLLALKFLSDDADKRIKLPDGSHIGLNGYVAEQYGISTKDLNEMEREFLFVIGFNLNLSFRDIPDMQNYLRKQVREIRLCRDDLEGEYQKRYFEYERKIQDRKRIGHQSPSGRIVHLDSQQQQQQQSTSFSFSSTTSTAY